MYLKINVTSQKNENLSRKVSQIAYIITIVFTVIYVLVHILIINRAPYPFILLNPIAHGVTYS
jgi:uncharacterized membrane protein (DUF485 family)